ncbi:hypothetical protein Belba_1828 [Belliella baltica DSM 15883]|uniref:DUF4199 domain-containing protein n=1 Tax=Belliella baltica (strain DSM 15883 / CIP 108006 / LMG 21964 / BA134) TaxID=866536 RepID=I3Z599_BELBD|nr:DUF4199 domain-containing protein [Belliella baltica]AFL84417.1 hypothetical protein Belba_1828 [Belliella baltica DSM 15883]
MNRKLLASYKFGLIGGVFCVAAFVVFKLLGMDPTKLSMLFGYFLIPFFLFIGIKFYRNQGNHGLLSFSDGMSVGFLIYSIIGLVSGLGIWIVLMLSPSLYAEIKMQKIEILNKNKDLIVEQVGLKSFETTSESLLNMTTLDIATNDFIWKIIPGLFFTIIISIILRRNFK